MFTKEKLEKWIKSLDTSIDNLNNGEVNDIINIAHVSASVVKTMIKNGFDFVDYDKDGDYEYVLSLDKKAKTKEEIDSNWENHLEMTKKDLGEEKFARLETINTKIFEMVQKIKSGESPKIFRRKTK